MTANTGDWKKFSHELIGKPVNIRIHQDYDEWKQCFSEILGFPARMSGGAFASEKESQFTIHLYVPETMVLEDRFGVFLHELAHIHLGHFGEREGDYLAKEAEADGWVAVNFSEEIKTIMRLLHWRRYGGDSESEIERPVVTQEQKERVRSEMGDWFILEDTQKSGLSKWMGTREEELAGYIREVKQ